MPIPFPHALYSVPEIRAIEQAALAALPAFTLMQRAGAAGAGFALEILGNERAAGEVLIVAGAGNNGGDALEAAARLAQAGISATVLLHADSSRLSSDSLQAFSHAKSSSAQFVDPAQYRSLLSSRRWALVIDGLFGIGLTRAIASPLSNLIDAVNSLPCPILALDVPSGLDANTGNIVGDNSSAVRATHTITFIGDKPGLHTGFGRDHAGQVRVASLGIDASHFSAPRARLGVPGLFEHYLRPRAHNSHKGSYGNVIVAGGSRGMAGAAILAARAAAMCGAGRVFAAFVVDPPAYDAAQPELMCRLADDVDLSGGTVVIGPGLGTAEAARALLSRALDVDTPLLLDADALNLVAVEAELQDRLARRARSALLTPHPLEAARLLGTSVAEVQADRAASARALARRFNAVAILKGSGSVIARPDGEIVVNSSGNPALATAGTGDVLSGICGALLAQAWPAWEAALAATWLHGHAADILVSQGIGPIGLVAGELIPCVRSALNRLTVDIARLPPKPGDRPRS